MMKIAVVGCLHGKLDQLYKDVQRIEKERGFLVDLVVVCGDFQALRNQNDLQCMDVSSRFLTIGDFPDYFMKKKHASHLTLVCGGNHEASNYFQTLPYGGWIAPNIYFMGYSNVVKVNGVKIGAISGIFNRDSVNKGHFEYLPYDSRTIKSVYHTRYLDVFKMMQLKDKLDVMFTHDWPLRVYKSPEDKEYLLRKRPNFSQSMSDQTLGSPLYELLLNKIKPKHWFAAHMHVHFETTYVHQSSTNLNNNQNDTNAPKKSIESTHFLALDKCSFNRYYLDIVNVRSDDFNVDGLQYDLDWLAILKCTDKYVSIQEYPLIKPSAPHLEEHHNYDDVKMNIMKILNKNLKIKTNNFSIDLPLNEKGEDEDRNRIKNFTNKQTTEFCELLQITDPMKRILARFQGKIDNPERISISDDENPDWRDESFEKTATGNVNSNELEMDYEQNNSGNQILAIESDVSMAVEQNTSLTNEYQNDQTNEQQFFIDTQPLLRIKCENDFLMNNQEKTFSFNKNASVRNLRKENNQINETQLAICNEPLLRIKCERDFSMDYQDETTESNQEKTFSSNQGVSIDNRRENDQIEPQLTFDTEPSLRIKCERGLMNNDIENVQVNQKKDSVSNQDKLKFDLREEKQSQNIQFSGLNINETLSTDVNNDYPIKREKNDCPMKRENENETNANDSTATQEIENPPKRFKEERPFY